MVKINSKHFGMIYVFIWIASVIVLYFTKQYYLYADYIIMHIIMPLTIIILSIIIGKSYFNDKKEMISPLIYGILYGALPMLEYIFIPFETKQEIEQFLYHTVRVSLVFGILLSYLCFFIGCFIKNRQIKN